MYNCFTIRVRCWGNHSRTPHFNVDHASISITDQNICISRLAFFVSCIVEFKLGFSGATNLHHLFPTYV